MLNNKKVLLTVGDNNFHQAITVYQFSSNRADKITYATKHFKDPNYNNALLQEIVANKKNNIYAVIVQHPFRNLINNIHSHYMGVTIGIKTSSDRDRMSVDKEINIDRVQNKNFDLLEIIEDVYNQAE